MAATNRYYCFTCNVDLGIDGNNVDSHLAANPLHTIGNVVFDDSQTLSTAQSISKVYVDNQITVVSGNLATQTSQNYAPLSQSTYKLQTTVDFGFATGLEGDTASVTVPATWVTASSIIVCSPASISTSDHDPDDVVVEGIVAYSASLVPGSSFDIVAYAPNGTWGQYYINCIGY